MTNSVRVELEKFERYGCYFYNCLLITTNAAGAELAHRVGEYPHDVTIAKIFGDASIVRMKNVSQISAFIAEGMRHLQTKIQFEIESD